MSKTLNDWINAEPGRDRLFAQEQLIVAVAECIWQHMEERKVTKADIAAALGKSKAFVTQILNGSRNMTLRTLSDIAFALGAKCEIQLRPRASIDGWKAATVVQIPAAVVDEHSVRHHAAESINGAEFAEAA
jgi:plasmid maintenance system antidote protein VapI